MARKPLEYYLNRDYTFKAEADPDGGWVISFPDLPGALTQADSPEEIGPMADDVRRLWIETEYEDGHEIPEPTPTPEYSGRFNLRLPRSLHARLADAAEREGVSLNQYVVYLLSTGLAGATPRPLPPEGQALSKDMAARAG